MIFSVFPIAIKFASELDSKHSVWLQSDASVCSLFHFWSCLVVKTLQKLSPLSSWSKIRYLLHIKVVVALLSVGLVEFFDLVVNWIVQALFLVFFGISSKGTTDSAIEGFLKMNAQNRILKHIWLKLTHACVARM